MGEIHKRVGYKLLKRENIEKGKNVCVRSFLFIFFTKDLRRCVNVCTRRHSEAGILLTYCIKM